MAYFESVPLDVDRGRGFALVQRDMDALVSKLRRTFDPKSRRSLLRKLRLLLAEAERLLDRDENLAA